MLCRHGDEDDQFRQANWTYCLVTLYLHRHGGFWTSPFVEFAAHLLHMFLTFERRDVKYPILIYHHSRFGNAASCSLHDSQART